MEYWQREKEKTKINKIIEKLDLLLKLLKSKIYKWVIRTACNRNC